MQRFVARGSDQCHHQDRHDVRCREKHESPQPGAEPFLSPRRRSSLLRSSCFVAAARSSCRWRRETRKNTWRVRASQLTLKQLLEESARPSEHHLLRAGGDENKGVGGGWEGVEVVCLGTEGVYMALAPENLPSAFTKLNISNYCATLSLSYIKSYGNTPKMAEFYECSH